MLATFTTSHFGEWKQSWHGMPRKTHVGGDSSNVVVEDNEGHIAAIDVSNDRIVCQRILDTPAGFAVDRDRIYVASMYGNRILVLDTQLNIIDSFATRLMNDLHSISISNDNLLVTSSGTDAVLELSPSGDLLWDWLAVEHGFDTAPSGHRVRVSRDRDYRVATISTDLQATHCNSAVAYRLCGRDVILTTLFHQGKLIAIDRATGHTETILRGLANPHSIRRYQHGWLLADSRSSAAVLVDEDFWIESVIESDFNWVQDVLPLDHDQLLIADANNSRFVIWDVSSNKPVGCVEYPSEWKVYQVEVVNDRWDGWLRSPQCQEKDPRSRRQDEVEN